ncbi:hypothetical protein [uncultured phage cr61_1]|uniref:Uncharacterized protein n=2 Tax=Caudoviricetes TaxID=2731619 RepID=A0AAE7V3F1_9CAUD|nr:hypothetical protein OJM08_gp77 [uncultured phage cr61_1]QWM90565.1 hypothetical protein [uncultured phage cr61_1]
MIDIDSVSREVSKETGYDLDTVKKVCQHVFKLAEQIMKSEDTSDILFNKLFKFKLKRRYKDNKQKEYTTK